MNDDQEQSLYEQFKDLSQKELNEAFKKACKYNQLDKVKYLLTSPELKKHADIHYNDEQGFFWACISGHLDIVKYLLNLSELKEHVNIHAENDRGFIYACEGGHLEVVKYLLNSSELKEHADIHAQYDAGFRWGCDKEKLEMIKYFIFEMNIKKTKYIENYLKDHPNEKVENMFKIRELNQSLEKDLYSNKINQKKLKL